MKMCGTGIDIIEVKRIKRSLEKNPRLIERIFSRQEIDYCNKKKNKWQHFAVRFAAKEAVIKALGDTAVNLKNIVISHKKNGQPQVMLQGKLTGFQDRLVVSLSHCKDYAVAQAILVE
ncbi:MAG: holo-ACP synthase [bacterium]